MTIRPDVEAVLNRLSPAEKTDLLNSLMARTRKEARFRAGVLADALESNLKVAGLRDDASLVREIRRRLTE